MPLVAHDGAVRGLDVGMKCALPDDSGSGVANRKHLILQIVRPIEVVIVELRPVRCLCIR